MGCDLVCDLRCDFGPRGHGSGAVICTVIWAARRARLPFHRQITAEITAKSQPNPNDLLGDKRLVGAVIWAVLWSVIAP